MFRLILIIVAAIVVWTLWRHYQAMNALQQKKARWVWLLGAVGLIVLVLTLTGRLNWLFAAATGLLAVVPKLTRMGSRFWPLIRGFLQMRAGAAANHAKMQSAFLLLMMDRNNGALSGEVLRGSLQGRKLASLSQAECLQLLDECQRDAQSMSLLAAYMDATFPQWRQGYEGKAQQQSAQHSAVMSKQEAADVLGVVLDADKKTIISAHKRLMQRLHPDRGGSDYLAVKINQAKAQLLS